MAASVPQASAALSHPAWMIGAMELWYPPTDQPHLFEWWRPLIQASRKARLHQFPWPIHIDEMVLVGRVDRGSRPAIWVYRHGEGRGELYLDSTGQPYRYTRTPNGPGHGRFTACEIDRALWAAGFHHVVEPVWYEDPGRWQRTGTPPAAPLPNDLPEQDGDPDTRPPTPPAAAPRRHRHLTVIEGGAEPKAG